MVDMRGALARCANSGLPLAAACRVELQRLVQSGQAGGTISVLSASGTGVVK